MPGVRVVVHGAGAEPAATRDHHRGAPAAATAACRHHAAEADVGSLDTAEPAKLPPGLSVWIAANELIIAAVTPIVAYGHAKTPTLQLDSSALVRSGTATARPVTTAVVSTHRVAGRVRIVAFDLAGNRTTRTVDFTIAPTPRHHHRRTATSRSAGALGRPGRDSRLADASAGPLSVGELTTSTAMITSRYSVQARRWRRTLRSPPAPCPSPSARRLASLNDSSSAYAGWGARGCSALSANRLRIVRSR
jgi:hypothetical protein